MFNKERLLQMSRAVLSAETSERSGSADFGKVLRGYFPSINWTALPVHGENTVFYCETRPDKKDIDLLCYTNIDTANPSHLSLWTETDFDPLAVTIKKGKVYGLGAAHEKMSIVPQALALEVFLEGESDLNILIAAGFGRESKMRGAKRLLQEVVKGKEVHKVFVTNPTENKILEGSAGRLKTKVFFPFSETEKQLRSEHDRKENISSQSKIYSFLGEHSLEGNTLYKVIHSCKSLPTGTVLLDLDGGSSTVTEPETTYFEVDFAPPFRDSMVSKFENFGELLLKLNDEMKMKFESDKLKKALHIGRGFDSAEGVTFFGYNLLPAKTTKGALDDWFGQFKKAVESVGGDVMITDAKTPYLNSKINSENPSTCLNVTEASVFEKICEDISIFGSGQDGASMQPNEFAELSSLEEACSIYLDVFNRGGCE